MSRLGVFIEKHYRRECVFFFPCSTSILSRRRRIQFFRQDRWIVVKKHGLEGLDGRTPTAVFFLPGGSRREPQVAKDGEAGGRGRMISPVLTSGSKRRPVARVWPLGHQEDFVEGVVMLSAGGGERPKDQGNPENMGDCDSQSDPILP